jgi:hypothetical protein
MRKHGKRLKIDFMYIFRRLATGAASASNSTRCAHCDAGEYSIIPMTIAKYLYLFATAVCAASALTSADQRERPIARIKESLICCPGDSIILDGWASIDPGGEVLAWIWGMEALPGKSVSSETGELVIEAPRDPKTYVVTLRVRDRDGNESAPDTAMLHVMSSPPRASARPDTAVKIGVRVQFAPMVVTHCDDATLFEWDFDDDGRYEYRSKRNGRTSKAFFKPGVYTTRFRVTDSRGQQAGALRTIRVSAGF